MYFFPKMTLIGIGCSLELENSLEKYDSFLLKKFFLDTLNIFTWVHRCITLTMMPRVCRCITWSILWGIRWCLILWRDGWRRWRGWEWSRGIMGSYCCGGAWLLCLRARAWISTIYISLSDFFWKGQLLPTYLNLKKKHVCVFLVFFKRKNLMIIIFVNQKAFKVAFTTR